MKKKNRCLKKGGMAIRGTIGSCPQVPVHKSRIPSIISETWYHRLGHQVDFFVIFNLIKVTFSGVSWIASLQELNLSDIICHYCLYSCNIDTLVWMVASVIKLCAR